MASPSYALDHQGHLTAFLLREFLAKMGRGVEAFEARSAFEYELARIGPEVLGPLNRFFETLPVTLGEAPLAEWYLDFLAGKSREWLPNPAAKAGTALRFFDLPHEPVAGRALQVAALLDYLGGGRGGDGELAVRLRAQGLIEDGDLTRRGRLVAQTLMNELLSDSAQRQNRHGLPYGPFVLDTMRAIFARENGAVPPGVAGRILEFATGISQARREAIYTALTAQPPRS